MMAILVQFQSTSPFAFVFFRRLTRMRVYTENMKNTLQRDFYTFIISLRSMYETFIFVLSFVAAVIVVDF